MSMQPDPEIIPLESHGQERRLALRVLEYWREIVGDRRWPTLSDVQHQIHPDLWSSCFVVKLEGEESGTLMHVGPALQTGDDDLIGRNIADVPSQTLLECAVSYIQEVMERKVPITVGGVFTDDQGTRILYRSILLPLSESGESVDHLLGAASCRPLREDDGAPQPL